MAYRCNRDYSMNSLGEFDLGTKGPTRKLSLRTFDPPKHFNAIALNIPRDTCFQYVEALGEVTTYRSLVSVLIERWRLEMHTFHFLVEERTIALKDVLYIFGFRIDVEVVMGMTYS
ncbi:hypothetical protein PIB30_022648 [Stylosanthes scabra]|uniref:Aminotransferase-like plant mobile domain-containing protein n=1 Tax=Stylosanthes scabra TaxID=79078 RepID=A0ABU6U967_9FABA|nr:hypothetical protein [Stylosanthes scabra]